MLLQNLFIIILFDDIQKMLEIIILSRELRNNHMGFDKKNIYLEIIFI